MNIRFSQITALLCALGLAAPVTASSDWSANNSDRQLNAVLDRTQELEDQVRALSQELAGIKAKQREVAVDRGAASLTRADVEELDTQVGVADYTEGLFISTSPALGIQLEFDGGSLVVSESSNNLDIRLLRTLRDMEVKRRAAGQSLPDMPLIVLSGKAEFSANWSKASKSNATSDIDLETAELVVLANINSWITGYMSVGLDSDSSSGNGVNRARNKSGVKFDKVFVTVGNLDQYPVYATVGQLYMPFGRHSGFAPISKPFTVSVGRVKSRGAIVGGEYSLSDNDSETNRVYGQIYALRGDVRPSTESRIATFGAHIGHDYKTDDWSTEVTASIINDIAQAEDYETARANNSTVLKKRVPGAAVFGRAFYGDFGASLEYVQALSKFDKADLTRPGNANVGAKPKALNIEGMYKFELLDRPATFSLGYGWSDEALGYGIAKERYLANMNYSYWKNTVFSLEVKHDRDLTVGTTSTNRGNPHTVTNERSTAVTAQFGYYF